MFNHKDYLGKLGRGLEIGESHGNSNGNWDAVGLCHYAVSSLGVP